MHCGDKRLALNDNVTISEYAWRTGAPSRMARAPSLEVGTQVPVEALIKGMIVQSGNDATIALAEKLGGTEDGFVQMMNTYAAAPGPQGHAFRQQLGRPAARSLHARRATSRPCRAR